MDRKMEPRSPEREGSITAGSSALAEDDCAVKTPPREFKVRRSGSLPCRSGSLRPHVTPWGKELGRPMPTLRGRVALWRLFQSTKSE